jgi:hypothetical protein
MSVVVHLAAALRKDARRDVQHLPAKICHDGPAPVSTYFIHHNENGTKPLKASLRGRELLGEVRTLPEGSAGLVIEPARESNAVDSNAGEDALHWQATSAFDKIVAWKHDSPPDSNDFVPGALDWMTLSRVLMREEDDS